MPHSLNINLIGRAIDIFIALETLNHIKIKVLCSFSQFSAFLVVIWEIFINRLKHYQHRNHIARENWSSVFHCIRLLRFRALIVFSSHPTLNCLKKAGGVNKFNALQKHNFLFTQIISNKYELYTSEIYYQSSMPLTL